ncbi:hypothetical protein CSB95_0215 [Pseudomonas aeruginosa]|nr:hypothetical protein CSC29_3791 [Pseudomonas aeruginosa]PRW06159.1 hypothetical protein CSB95_0215 [Pseudomonas aeruginosa]
MSGKRLYPLHSGNVNFFPLIAFIDKPLNIFSYHFGELFSSFSRLGGPAFGYPVSSAAKLTY